MTRKEVVRPQTVADVVATFQQTRQFLAKATLRMEYVIEDYPIGRQDRGRCWLQVEVKGGQFRTVRTTTDARGRWCKPKKSVYMPYWMCVVTDHELLNGKEAAWLWVGPDGVHLCFANGDQMALSEAPCLYPPRRVEHRYKTVTRTFHLGGVEGEPKVQETEHLIEADPAALCDAWDAWCNNVKSLIAECQARLRKVAS